MSTANDIFCLATAEEESRSRSLRIQPAYDSEGEQISPGDEIAIEDDDRHILNGTVHAGRSSIKLGAIEYRDLEIETEDGRRIPFRSHTVTKRSPETPRGISSSQWDVIVRLRNENRLTPQRPTTPSDAQVTGYPGIWNTFPTVGKSIRLATILSMVARGWLRKEIVEGHELFRLTDEAMELARLDPTRA